MLYRFGSGETCILTTSCLLSGEAYTAEAIAEQDIRAVVVSLVQFQKLLNESQDFRQLVFTSFAQRLTLMIAKIEEIAFMALDCRLARVLVDMAGAGNSFSVTHGEIAAVIGTAREVVSRKLGLWENNGWILRGRGVIEIVRRTEIEALARSADPGTID